MAKEELVSYLSYYLNKGKSVEELKKEALEKGYSKKDVYDAFSELNIKVKKPSAGKIILLVLLIFIVVIAIVSVIILNLKGGPVIETSNIKEKNIEQIIISTQLFNQSNSGTTQAMDTYFLNNPTEKQNSKKFSDNFKNCTTSEAQFSGDIQELNGSLYVEDLGNGNCFVSYRSDLTMDCNYTKNQIRITYQTMQEKGVGDVAGPLFYFVSYFEIKMRMLGDLIKAKINETYENTGRVGNLTLGEDLMTEHINRTFSNPETGKNEIVECLVY